MKIIKDKKLIIPILIATVLVIILNSIITIKQYEKYQNKVNIVIANIVGEIKEKYPDVKESEIIAILNMDKDALKVGYSILEKYGINANEISVIEGLENQEKEMLLTNIISIIFLLVLLIIILFVNAKQKDKKIQDIIKYIEEINRKNYDLEIEENSEDELSHLKNELYKITVMLKEQADNSIKDKKIFFISQVE